MMFKELIEGLGEKMGIGGEIEIDDEGRAFLEFDGMGVVLQGVDEVNKLTFLSTVGMPPPENPARLYKTLLEANYLFEGTGGATLSINPDSGGVMLATCLDSRALTVEDLMDALDKFLDSLIAWRDFVNDYREIPSEEKSSEEDNFCNLTAFRA